jgi:hypothetical protein
VVPAGYFLKGPGQVAQCPKGEYKEGTGPAGNCTKCAFGVTTTADASISQDNCTQVVAGYYAAAMTGKVITATKPCPQKYYCTGGTPTGVFTPATPNPDATNGTIFKCPKGTWTQDVASTALEQCSEFHTWRSQHCLQLSSFNKLRTLSSNLAAILV